MHTVRKDDGPQESVSKPPSSRSADAGGMLKVGKLRLRRGIALPVVGVLLVLVGFLIGMAVRGSLGSGTTFFGFPVATNDTQSSTANSSASNLGSSISEIQALFGSKSAIDSASSATTSASTTATTIEALLESTGDPYARYYSPEEYAQYKARSSASSIGLGIVFSEYHGKAYVVSVGAGTPAAAAGLQPGDFIVSVNGVSRSSWDTDAVVDACQGAIGTQVTLAWRRPTSRDDLGGEAFSAVLTISEITVPDVTSRVIDGVGYISVLQFGSTSADGVAAAITNLAEQGVSGYVIDVRGNPGGHIDQAVAIASMVIPDGTVAQISSKSGVTKTAVDTSKHLTDKPLVVLVNGDTASCSEVFAAAVQDSGRGTIVGSATFGKGTIQSIQELSAGGAVKFTIAYYLGSNGETIDGVGVNPSIVVTMDPKLIGTDQDMQLAAAIDALGTSTYSGTASGS